MSAPRPRVAVLLDENTSGGATRYEASKNYFSAVHGAGGMPFGIPYFGDMAAMVTDEFDGLLCVGGRFAYPDEWYVEGARSAAPASARLAVERALMQGFLDRDKPVLGICAGMQMLGCLHGCRLTPDVARVAPHVLRHDQQGLLHDVTVAAGTHLARIVEASAMRVNSLHREALVEISAQVQVGALAADGIVEAVEIAARRFAIGLQWHQEAFAGEAHPGNAVFDAFVQACRPAAAVELKRSTTGSNERANAGQKRDTFLPVLTRPN